MSELRQHGVDRHGLSTPRLGVCVADARVPVWMALSQLYLDCAPDDEHATMARTLAVSPYSLDQLRSMLFDDVHPALRANPWSVAGVWSGLEEPWLVARIERRRAHPRWLRGVACLSCVYPQRHWRALQPLIAAERAGNGAMTLATWA